MIMRFSTLRRAWTGFSLRGTLRGDTFFTEIVPKDKRFRQRKPMGGDMEAHLSNRRLSEPFDPDIRRQFGRLPFRRKEYVRLLTRKIVCVVFVWLRWDAMKVMQRKKKQLHWKHGQLLR
jgi:hypothetical protein